MRYAKPLSDIMTNRRKRLVHNYFEKINLDDRSMERVKEYCEQSFKKGYYCGCRDSSRYGKSSIATSTKPIKFKYFSIESDTEFKCPVCEELIQPKIKHEHNGED